MKKGMRLTLQKHDAAWKLLHQCQFFITTDQVKAVWISSVQFIE